MVGKNLSILVGGGDALHHDSFVKAFKNRVTTHDNPHHKVLGRQRMLHGRKADGTEFPCIIGIKMVNHNTRVAGYIRKFDTFFLMYFYSHLEHSNNISND